MDTANTVNSKQTLHDGVQSGPGSQTQRNKTGGRMVNTTAAAEGCKGHPPPTPTRHRQIKTKMVVRQPDFHHRTHVKRKPTDSQRINPSILTDALQNPVEKATGPCLNHNPSAAQAGAHPVVSCGQPVLHQHEASHHSCWLLHGDVDAASTTPAGATAKHTSLEASLPYFLTVL
jgi:hypothetical protein